jgi:hypothetical protein
MAQLSINEFEKTPSELLDVISENELFSALNSDSEAQTKAKAPENPAPEQAPEPDFFNQPPPPPGATNLNASEIVSGELATELLNRIIPVLLTIGVERFLGVKAPRKHFELTAAEKNTISPILDQCLAKMNISFENPFIALGLSLSFVYGSKIIDVANNPELSKVTKQSAQKVQREVNKEYNPAAKGSTRKPGETRGRKPKPVKLDIG